MKKNEFKSSYKLEDAPKSLSETMFYGLELDDEQKAFRDTIYDPKKLLIACNAKAGTGKTTISVAVAHLLVQYGFYNGIVYLLIGYAILFIYILSNFQKEVNKFDKIVNIAFLFGHVLLSK